METTLNDYKPYPPRADRVAVPSTEKVISPQTVTDNFVSVSKGCRSGFLLASGQCLCPPSYYGDTCQWQSDRLTIILQIDLQPDVYDLQTTIFTFILRIDQTIHHEQIMHFHQQQERLKHIIYLIAPTDKQPISARIDACQVTSNSVHHQMVWIFDVPFAFLPVNRLALRLSVGQSLPSISCSIMCVHGVCKSYANNSRRHYCQCEDNWSGLDCNLPSRINCSKAAKEIQGVCVCPLGYYGRECYIRKTDMCRRHKCQNNGTCIPFDLRIKPFYVCRCSKNYYGSRCQLRAATALASDELRTNALSTVRYVEFCLPSSCTSSNELIHIGQYLVPFLSTYMPHLQTLRLWRLDDFPWTT
ncbi:unnamed protein product, partial [Rotaria sp. Silwood1]